MWRRWLPIRCSWRDEASLYLQATTMAVWTDATDSRPGWPRESQLLGHSEPPQRSTTRHAHAQHARRNHRPAAANAPGRLPPAATPAPLGPRALSSRATHPRLELVVLPVAAPDLKPQAQVWKTTRCAVSHHHPHPRLSTLADAFDPHLTSTPFATSRLARHGFDRLCPIFI